tara:strand:+ start:677 stop:1600 length:924 start_codon:yes stop_codon:yes gene_type:complete
MAKELPYFKFYTGEWLNGDITIETFEAQGLFINLCACYWSKQGDFTKSKALKRFRGFEEVFKDLETEGFITVNKNDKITIKFLDEQIKERVKTSKSASIKGSKGGRPRKEITVEPILKPSKTVKPKLDTTERENRFNAFWDVYNKKNDRKKCLNKFLKLKETEVDKIASTIVDYVKDNSDVNYRKNPLTYLNGECWNDEIEEKATKPTENNQGFKNSFNSVEKVVDLFNETPLISTIKKYTTSKEKIKVRLDEFLEKESLKPKFKNRQTEEVLGHFINSLEYNVPVKVVDLEAKRITEENWANRYNT